MNVEKVENGLFVIRVPLPANPLKYTNSYVITGERSLVIDTGLNMRVCYLELVTGLRRIGIELEKTDLFVTHCHADHVGLGGKIGKRWYMSDIDGKILESFMNFASSIGGEVLGEKDLDYWTELYYFYRRNGFPREESKEVFQILQIHPAMRRCVDTLEYEVIEEGEILEYGNYQLEVILTPGHTPGHMCLYDEEKKLLFSGDHLLFDITPNIAYWKSLEDSLGSYLKSLEKISYLEVDLTLPGHGSLHYGSIRDRIEEIYRHHERRLDEILKALRSGSKTAWEVASNISWDIAYERWEDVLPMQKWFAVGEAISHLIYLEKRGRVRGLDNGEKIYFELVEQSDSDVVEAGGKRG